jgi:CheY-like chemotaxis protein
VTAPRSEPSEGGRGEIFVVDDNPNNLNLLTTILREAGHVVRVANSGRRALAAVQARPPELILLDVNMPDMDGHEVCARLKADARTERVPVIFLSALDDPGEKVSAFRQGGVDYITKPFHVEEVLARVEGQLRLARLRALLEERNRELSARNAELLAWKSQADRIFSTLAEVLPGTTLDGKYLVGEKIGMGGAAIVYQGTQLASGRPVAVKILRPQPGPDERNRRARRLLVEGLSATRVEHASAVAVLDSGLTGAGIAYLVMELLRGRSLSAELAAVGPLAIERAVQIFAPVCQVLSEAHAAGVVHRDVKPSNIFLHRGEDGQEVVKVVDFGIASLAEGAGLDASTTIGRLAGTPAYMSPERFLGQGSGEGADVYGVAMALYEAIAGRLPFTFPADASLAAIVVRSLNEPPLPLRFVRPDVPELLAALVMRGLDKHPSRRPAMAELLVALEATRLDVPGAPAP